MSKTWGIPTWLFLHSLLAQMPPSVYSEETLKQIKALCSILPCPDCAAHATAYLSQISFAQVPTVEACRRMLWVFHNTVNMRRRVPIFSYESMDVYLKTNLAVVYRVFLKEFTRPRQIPKLFIDSMLRRRIVHDFQTWLNRTVKL